MAVFCFSFPFTLLGWTFLISCSSSSFSLSPSFFFSFCYSSSSLFLFLYQTSSSCQLQWMRSNLLRPITTLGCVAVCTWLDLVQVLCIQSQPLWVHVCNSAIMYRYLLSLALNKLLTSSSAMIPESEERQYDKDALFRTKHFTVSCSLHADWLLFSVLIAICCSIRANTRYRWTYKDRERKNEASCVDDGPKGKWAVRSEIGNRWC